MPSGGHQCLDAHQDRAPASLGGDQSSSDTQASIVAATDLAQARSSPVPNEHPPAPELNGGQPYFDAQTADAPASVNGDQCARGSQSVSVPADALLNLYADLVDDLECVRIATENRKRSLVQVKGLEGSPEEKRLAEMAESLHKIERAAIRDLERQMTAHPLGGFAEQNVGVGLKSLARLLGAIGDPGFYVDRETGEVIERTVSKLWAYCGYKPGQGKYKDQDHKYSRVAKTRCYLIAESCMKNRKSPYRPVYEAARAKYEERDLPDWRKNSMALRVVSKEILKDLWKFRRGQFSADPHPSRVAPENLQRGQMRSDAQSRNAASTGDGQPATDAQPICAVTEVLA